MRPRIVRESPHSYASPTTASMRCFTSGVSFAVTSSARMLSPIWSIRDAPVMTELTRGFDSTHAIASWPVLQPSSAAISPSR